MTIVLSVITWIGIISILIGSMFIGKIFYLKARGNPTGEFTEHNYDQKYNSEGLSSFNLQEAIYCILFDFIFCLKLFWYSDLD